MVTVAVRVVTVGFAAAKTWRVVDPEPEVFEVI
jgi:hypothetical protein